MSDLKGKTCCKTVSFAGGWRSAPCGNKAKVEVEGKFYCGVHDPIKRAAKEAEKDAQRKAQWAKNDELYKRRELEKQYCAQFTTEQLEAMVGEK